MKTWLRLTLITMTIGGGFTGILVTYASLFHSTDHRIVYYMLMTGFLGLYGFVTASGLLFVHDSRRIRPLIAALTIQIPWISTPLFVYKFTAGFYAVATIGGPREAGNVGLYFGGESLLGNTFRFAFNQEIPSDIGINLWALLLVILIWRSVRTPETASQPTITATADGRTI